jgi:hypothetical protein
MAVMASVVRKYVHVVEQLARQIGNRRSLCCRPSVHKNEVLSLHASELPQSLLETIDIRV